MNEVELLVEGRLADPHHLLGAHPHDGGFVVRAWRPEAQAVVARPWTALSGSDDEVARRNRAIWV